MKARTAALIFGAILFVAPATQAATLNLAWDPANDGVTTGYIIHYGTSPGSYTRSISVGLITSFAVANLADATTYYFVVQAYNDSGELSALSAEVRGSTGGGITTLSSGPSNLVAKTRKLRIDLTWTPAASAPAGYTVEVGSAAGQSNVASVPVGDVTVFAIESLPAGTYYIRVRNSGTGVSVPSNEVSVTTSAGNKGGKPTAPKNLVASTREDNTIDLAWDLSDDDDVSYRIEAGTGRGRKDVGSFETGVTTQFSIGNVPLTQTYFIRVSSVNGRGASASNEVLVLARGGNEAPRKLTANVSGSLLRLNWERPFNALGVSGYLLEAGSGRDLADLGTFPVAENSLVAQVPYPGTYYVRVRAQRNNGHSSASNEVVFNIGGYTQCTQPPSAPFFSAHAAGTVANLWWAPGPGDPPSSYLLDIGSAPGRRDLGTVEFAADTLAFSSPAPNGTYALRLSAVNACGASASGTEASVTIGGPAPVVPGAAVNLVEQVAGRAVQLTWAPPTTGGEPNRYIIEASDTSGNVIVTLDTNNLSTMFVHGEVPPGTYVVRVKAANAAGVGAPSNAVTVVVTP